MDEKALKRGLIIGGVFVVLVIILVATSFDTVEPIEWGLKYNSITKSISNGTIYNGGRYWIWPFHAFVTFPSTLKTIEFSDRPGAQSSPLSTRTQEGLALSLHVSFQYQLQRNDIGKLYGLTMLAYESTFIKIAKDVILQAAGSYDAPSYWTKRKEIGQDMQQELDVELKKAYASCQFLQLLQIGLPETYEESIVLTQVEVQKKRMKQYEQQATQIRSQIDVMTSQTVANITGINATAAATAYNIEQTAIGTALNNTIQAETQAYQGVKTKTGLAGEDLNKYVYYLGLMNQKQAKLLIGLNSGLVNMN